MLPLNLLLAFVLSHLTLTSRATPITITTSSLTTRSPDCSNAPGTKPGNHLNARILPPSPLSPRRPNPTLTIWCTPGTRTYISFTPGGPLPSVGVYTTLQAAKTWTTRYIQESGDGQIQYGLFNFVGPGGIHVTVSDANNHQVTYGVMGSVVVGLEGLMARDGYGEGEFEVFDGANMVGKGMVRLS